ncbi:TPA: hypothetical protein ACSP7Y_002203 [Serratia fonticola]
MYGQIHSVKEGIQEGINAYLVEFPKRSFYVAKVAGDIPLLQIGDHFNLVDDKVMLNGAAIYRIDVLTLKNFEDASKEFESL